MLPRIACQVSRWCSSTNTSFAQLRCPFTLPAHGPAPACHRTQMGGGADADLDALDHDNLQAVAQLASSERYRTIMAAVRAATAADDAGQEQVAWAGPSEEDPTYK